MVGRLLVGFVWLKLQLSVSRQVDFQWGSCSSIFSFLWHGWQTFSGVREAQSLLFCLMVGRVDFQWVRVAQYLNFCVMIGGLLVGFVWLNLLFSVSWLVDFQWGSCGSIFSFLCHGWQTFSGLRVAQSLVFCVIVGRLLVGFVLLNLQSSVLWQVDFQWGWCGSIFSFLFHGRQTFSGVREAQPLVFCVKVGDLQQGSCGSIFSFLSHGWQTFGGVRAAQSLVLCVMVGRLLVGFVWLNLQFSASWLGDFQGGSCGSNFSFLCHGRQIFSGVGVAQSLLFCLMVGRVDFQWVRVAQYLDFCVMIGGLLIGFVWLNLQFSVLLQVDFQWASCCSIFSFLCHCRQIFSGVRVAQSLVFFVMVGRLLLRFVWLNLQSSVLWQVDFQWGWCGSIFSFLFHGRQTFSGVREAQSLVFCVKVGDLQQGSCGSIFSFLSHGWQTFGGVRAAQSLVFCVMVGRLLVGFVWLNLQFSASWLGDFQGGSCGSNFSFVCHGRQIFSGVGVAQSLLFCLMVGRVDFQWVRVAQYLDFCVMIGGLLIGFVWLNLLFSVSWLVDFQWGSCGSIFSFLCHGWQTFSGLRVAQSLVFCVIVGRLLVGFMLLNLQFSVSLQVDFQWGSCGPIFSFLCHGWQTFSGIHVAQSLVFCVMVGRFLVGFVWLNLLFSVSWLVDFQVGSCGSIFSFLCYGRQTFSGVRVSQSLDFCVMLARLLVGFVCLNLQFSGSWLVDFQWGSCGSIFSFLCHG